MVYPFQTYSKLYTLEILAQYKSTKVYRLKHQTFSTAPGCCISLCTSCQAPLAVCVDRVSGVEKKNAPVPIVPTAWKNGRKVNKFISMDKRDVRY